MRRNRRGPLQLRREKAATLETKEDPLTMSSFHYLILKIVLSPLRLSADHCTSPVVGRYDVGDVWW